jgi:hypothetical protein
VVYFRHTKFFNFNPKTGTLTQPLKEKRKNYHTRGKFFLLFFVQFRMGRPLSGVAAGVSANLDLYESRNNLSTVGDQKCWND